MQRFKKHIIKKNKIFAARCDVSLYCRVLGWDLRADPLDMGFHRSLQAVSNL